MIGGNTQIEILILAAGASRRLGQPKQLVKFKGATLINQMTSEAIKAKIGGVTVVTGAHKEAVADEIRDLNAEVYFNEEWQEGIGSSIRNGLRHLLQNKPETNAIVITMVDQPFVNAVHLQKLANAYNPSRHMIIASAYAGTFGVPVLVDSFYFDMLLGLKGDEGGKKIFVNYLKNIVEIPFIEGSIDIDEQSDLKTLE
jgi:molybdenum cofactor cytidylyltransferase